MWRRKPRWEVVVRSRRAATRPIRHRITKNDRVDVNFPPGRSSVTITRPSRRWAKARPYDRLDILRNGVLLSALPIHIIRYDARTRRVVLTAYERTL